MYRRILLPLDGSSLAEEALPYAIAQAGRFKAELILLRVLEPIVESLGRTSTGVLIAEERTREIARLYLERVADRIGEDGLAVRVEVIGGRPYHEIIQYAQTNRVVRGADVPVLLVRAEKKETRDTL